MFYLVFFPAGILMRVFGNDPMARKLGGKVKSYLIVSKPIKKNHIERPFWMFELIKDLWGFMEGPK